MDISKKLLKGRYQLIERIANKELTSLYKARDVHKDRLVAIKTISRNNLHEQKFISYGQQQILFSKRMGKGFLIPVFDFGVGDERYFLVFEWVDSLNLKQVLACFNDGCLLIEAAAIILQLCQGLAAAHAMGFVHGNINTQNILLTADGYVRVVDFGLTSLWSPPGLTKAEGQVADVFALGKIFSKIIGQKELSTSRLKCVKIVKPVFKQLRLGMRSNLSAVIDRACEVSLTRRYPDACELLKAVEDVLRKEYCMSNPGRKLTPKSFLQHSFANTVHKLHKISKDLFNF
ncbi:MAG: hypothetical protein RLZ12_517 [Bacillota bacterium]|jgi:serine/threonine protein kinase